MRNFYLESLRFFHNRVITLHRAIAEHLLISSAAQNTPRKQQCDPHEAMRLLSILWIPLKKKKALSRCRCYAIALMSHTTIRKTFAITTDFSISQINYINIITNPLSLAHTSNWLNPRFKTCLMHYCRADQETDILVCVRHHISPSLKLILLECARCRARTLTREHSCIFKYHVNTVSWWGFCSREDGSTLTFGSRGML